MKEKKLTHYWILVISILLNSACNTSSENNILLGFEMNESEQSWRKKIDSLLILGTLEKPDSNYKPTSYRCTLSGIPVEVEINDALEHGSLRVITYNLGGDTSYLQTISNERGFDLKTYELPNGVKYKSKVAPEVNRAFSEREYPDGIKIYDFLKSIYGEPDSSRTFYESYKYILPSGDTLDYKPLKYSSLFGNKKGIIDSFKNNPDPSVFAYWETDNYAVSLYLATQPRLIKPTSEGARYLRPFQSCLYPNSFLQIKSLKYDSLLEVVKDSLANSYEIKDLVNIYVGNPQWIREPRGSRFDYSIQAELYEVSKPRNADDREIVSVRFDIVFVDEFNESLCTIPGLTREFDSPVTKHRGYVYFGGGYIFGVRYNQNHENQGYEKARKYSESHRIKAVADVRAIRFSDNTVVK